MKLLINILVLTVTSDFGDLGERDRYIGWTRDNRFKNKKLNNVKNVQCFYNSNSTIWI